MRRPDKHAISERFVLSIDAELDGLKVAAHHPAMP
jgi:hypothetical protein